MTVFTGISSAYAINHGIETSRSSYLKKESQTLCVSPTGVAGS